VIPYAEKIIADHLRDAVDTRVVGRTPSSTDDAWIRLTQLDARAVGGSRADHLIEFLIQLDCYAGKTGGQPEANLLARTTREALVEMPELPHEDAVVAGVDIRGHARIPDLELDDPARERFILTAVVWMHPAPEGS
jgi:hypothetical protein